MSKIGDYFFEFPASRGLQGNTVVLMMTVPARALTRVLASDNHGNTLERSQRELNPARAKKFYEYLRTAYEKKEPFIIPPLVGNCDSFIEFEEYCLTVSIAPQALRSSAALTESLSTSQ